MMRLERFDTMKLTLIEVPNLIGLSVTELEPLLINLRLKASGEGDVVVQQSPKPGEKVKEGSTIRIYLDSDDGASD
ncbi:PASTA domain-containing protein [Bacillus licheniformis]|nr:PASTA domain-containing protein [Bacillus licheniformis]